MAVFSEFSEILSSVLHDLSATFQRDCFWQILAAMQTAEDEVHSISDIACESIGGHAFSVTAYASRCKLTLEHYSLCGGYSSGKGYRSDGGYCSEGGRSDSSRGSRGGYGRNHKCFGCRSTQHTSFPPIEYCRATVHVPVIEEGADRLVHLSVSASVIVQDAFSLGLIKYYIRD